MTPPHRSKFAEAALIDWREPPPAEAQGGIVTVGNFDGVHLGHAALIRQARELGSPVTAITFEPHPLKLLSPERFQPPLTIAEDRACFLREVGADAVVILHTTPELLSLGPAEFFQEILVKGFGATGIVEGFNFRFGRHRAGDLDMLRQLCARQSIPLRVAEPFALNGVVVSSSRVRNALLAGDMVTAARLIGRQYLVRGLVGTGAQRGRTIGFPTANLEAVETLLPAEGVYAVRACVGDTNFPGAANIGPNPTFGESARKIEVHLIGYSGDLYGKPLRVEFVERLRETRKFAGVDDLVTQLRRDVEKARSLIGDGHERQ
jgi:riboflavin kinase/FMN adenylyltransferase